MTGVAEPRRAPARRGRADRKPRDERWNDLVDVATQAFHDNGYDATSLQQIADEVGMLKGSLYYYFQSKEDLLFEVISRVHLDGLVNLQRLVAGPGTVAQILEAAVIGHMQFMSGHLTGTSVFLRDLSALPMARQEEITTRDGGYQGVFRDLLARGVASGEFRADLDVKVSALSLLGSLNWFHRWYRADGALSPEQIGREVAGIFVRGFVAD
ncbi:TetR/AcrR family transcriptional regulator [Nakamurella alba]|uniref:TetR/AcrR family transcriptional regulator n=1 Tax=Nakamurella alba TaxID=2665158 RepID=UPI0018AAC75F|nr:TetR/AcrR family transcriptional regulator [Nakamurella alba]